MRPLPNVGEVMRYYAHVLPDKIGARDLERAMTFREWNGRSCRFANALLGMGLAKGDRIAVLAYNCIEWLEIYVATAKAGLIVVPINFRLTKDEIAYVVEHSGASVLLYDPDLDDEVADAGAEVHRALGRVVNQLDGNEAIARQPEHGQAAECRPFDGPGDHVADGGVERESPLEIADPQADVQGAHSAPP